MYFLDAFVDHLHVHTKLKEDGTAKAGTDYYEAKGTLTFEKGEITKNITYVVRCRLHWLIGSISIRIVNDDVKEDDNVFKIVLENPSSNAQLSAHHTCEVKIIDDDGEAWL